MSTEVKVVYRSTANQSYFEQAITNWIQDINRLLGRTAFVRNDSSSRDVNIITVEVGSHSDLWGFNPDDSEGENFIYYGSWQVDSWYVDDWSIASCGVRLCNELRGVMCNPAYFKNIVYEELTECLGCGNDQFRNYNSMFSEIWYVGKNNMLWDTDGRLSQDGQVVELLYNPTLRQGTSARVLIDELTPTSSGCLSLEQGNTLNFLTAGQSYNIKTFALHRPVSWVGNTWYWLDTQCHFSDLSPEQTITVGGGFEGTEPHCKITALNG